MDIVIIYFFFQWTQSSQQDFSVLCLEWRSVLGKVVTYTLLNTLQLQVFSFHGNTASGWQFLATCCPKLNF